jgi:glyoxylase-like metal-dependent hydrolase (beta-lactamase superfamily II)/rhodanese-related sulfurtransferase
MDLELLVTAGLGDNTYLIVSGDEAAVVDPQRDIGRFMAAAQAHGASIRAVVETHVHNDYVSGALELRDATGADIVAPAKGGYRFPFRGTAEGDEIKLGDILLVAMETPGHTPEHISYAVYEPGSDHPLAIFTGGSLMVGNAGRTDLLGPALTDELTRAQFRSLRRLGSFPDDVQILPTHGAGSFCGAGGGPRERTSTIAQERTRNRALAAASSQDEAAFSRQQLSNLLAYPHYYANMAPINRAGPAIVRHLRKPSALGPEEVAGQMESGAWVVDARWRVPFARAHIPGSVSVELGDSFASYVGWMVPFDSPVVLVLPEPEDEALDEAVTQLLRIGYERVAGYLEGGIDTWRASGRPTRSYPVAGLEELCRAYRVGGATNLVDVRQDVEWDKASIPGSQHLFVGDLADRIEEVSRDGEAWIICATGMRSTIAASVMDAAGIPVRLVDGTGVKEFLQHCGPKPALAGSATGGLW